MDISQLQDWIQDNPAIASIGTIVLMIILYGISRTIFGRGLIYTPNGANFNYYFWLNSGISGIEESNCCEACNDRNRIHARRN